MVLVRMNDTKGGGHTRVNTVADRRVIDETYTRKVCFNERKVLGVRTIGELCARLYRFCDQHMYQIGCKIQRGSYLSKESTTENPMTPIEPVDDRIRIFLHRCSEDD